MDKNTLKYFTKITKINQYSRTILAKIPVVPKSSLIEGFNENFDSAMTIVWFKTTLITCVFPSLKSDGDHGAVND